MLNLFRTHDKETSTKKAFNIAMQTTLENLLPWRSKQSTKWAVKLTHTNECI